MSSYKTFIYVERKHQNTDDKIESNIVIFIGGVPAVGKTSIAGFVARELGIDVMLCGDYLREFIRPILEGKHEYDTLFTSVYDAWKPFGEMTDENIIKGYRSQSKFISKGLNALMERANKNGENLLLESLYFCPDELDSIRNGNVISLYIHNSSESAYRKMIMERVKYTHPKSPGDRLAQNIHQYITIMNYTLRLCKQYNLKTFDNTGYLKTRDEILSYIKGRIAGMQ